MAVEALVGPIVEKLVSLAADAVAGQLRAAWGLKEELEKLHRLLQRIQSVLADAEEKQTVDADVKSWLNALKKVAYEADDVLDELNYETLRHKAAEVAPDNKTPCSGKVRDFFSSHKPLLIRVKMGRKVSNLLEEITKIADESKKFNFKEQPETPAPVIETCSFVEESEVVGRRGEKDEIVKLLINKVNHNAENVAVLPIVGMGGLGKTTLAQLIYNDVRVVDYFELRAWVCVSDPWDAKRIIQKILKLATKEKFESPSMEELHLALQKALAQKRFLIVLDDVWEEDPIKWNALKDLLRCGGQGSVVIVTTRNRRVSDITGTLECCRPPCLSEDESWNLFSKTAFAPGAERPQELDQIGREIAKKCGGLPLALRMLGSLLYMERDKTQWSKIKESDMWNIETGILPALRLSYKHLPSHSKRCFTFCAIFPKDYEMEKEKLINLWMAHGFIPSDGGRLEVKGNEIFNQLLQRSFLQDFKAELISETFSSYVHLRTTCRMHDLVHDLALSIAGNDFVAVQKQSSKAEVIKNAYHLSYSIWGEFNIKHTLRAYPYLRTILQGEFTAAKNINMNVKDSTSLRVLTLDGYILKLPSSMKCLQHLRYLQLQSRELSELPETICTLFNLQTLDLSECESLLCLPKRMSCMISLRHLYLDGCEQLTTMAPCMGRLTNLRTLTLYVVGEESGRGIGELQGLQLSSGLKLRNLRSVKDVKESREVNLHSKEVPLLSLDWTGEEGGGGISNAEQVLEELKPPGCLKFLEILGYEGLNFPKWMADRLLLQHLVKLRLHHCKGLQRLPPLWQLSSLKELSLEGMKNLKYIISDNPPADDTTAQAFPSLKTLKIKDLESLENWRENENAQLQEANCFPALVDWEIRNCPEMASSLPLARCLKSLELLNCKKIPLGSMNALTSLVSLEYRNYEEELMEDSAHPHVHDSAVSFLPHGTLALGRLRCLEKLTILSRHEISLTWGHEDEKEEEGSGHSSSLKELELWRCDWIFSSPRSYGLWTGMTSLETLSINSCDALVALPRHVLRGLKSLRRLDIFGCSYMTGELSAGTDACLLPQLEHMCFIDCLTLETVPPIGGPSLKELWIGLCQNLVSLAASEQDLGRLTSLERLHIDKCPRLTSLALNGLPALRNLRLQGCTNLTSLLLLPEGAVLPTLEELTVWRCPELEKKCARGGEYWTLISNIPKCEIGED